jgi:hypothetical protein
MYAFFVLTSTEKMRLVWLESELNYNDLFLNFLN